MNLRCSSFGVTHSIGENAIARNRLLDAVRSFAIFGMLLRNIYVFGMPSTAYAVPIFWSGEATAEILAFGFVELFVDGSMRTLFSILFGATALMLLSSGSNQSIERIDRYFWRLLTLLAVGLVHSYLLLSTIDILFVYGVLGLLIFPLRNYTPRKLLNLALAGMLFSAALATLDFSHEFEIYSDQQTTHNIEEVDVRFVQASASGALLPVSTNGAESSAQRLEEGWVVEILERQSDYLVQVFLSFESSLHNHTIELFRSHLLDVGVMILIGMALFKLGFLSGDLSTKHYICVCIASYSLGLFINGWELIASYPGLFVDLELPDYSSMTYDVGRLAVAMGHLSFFAILFRSRPHLMVFRLLGAAGRMPLTNYLLQTLICIHIFFGFGFGLFGSLSHGDLLMLAITIGLFQLLGSIIYLRFFRQGPVEWLLSKCSQQTRSRAGQHSPDANQQDAVSPL